MMLLLRRNKERKEDENDLNDMQIGGGQVMSNPFRITFPSREVRTIIDTPNHNE